MIMDLHRDNPDLREYMGGSFLEADPIASEDGPEVHEGVEEALEGVVAAAWSVLEGAPESVVPDPGGEAPSIDFFVRFRPSGWAAAVSASISTEAKKGLPRQFCKLFRMQQSATYGTDELGDVVGHTVAAEWCNEMHFYYNIWRNQDDPDFRSTETVKKSYVEGAATMAFVSALPVGSPVLPKFFAILTMEPVNPA
jgi:hypothetical protein